MKKLLVLSLVVLASAGCSTMKGTAQALAEDGAIIDLNLNSPWGEQSLRRIGTTTNTVVIDKDGRITINPRTSTEDINTLLTLLERLKAVTPAPSPVQ